MSVWPKVGIAGQIPTLISQTYMLINISERDGDFTFIDFMESVSNLQEEVPKSLHGSDLAVIFSCVEPLLHTFDPWAQAPFGCDELPFIVFDFVPEPSLVGRSALG
jgi:hypothetical protein